MGQTHCKDGLAYGRCDRCGQQFIKAARGRPYRYCSSACAIVPLEDRFYPNVDTSGDCWLWTGKRNADGYGELEHRKRLLKAHRVALTLTGIAIPPGKEVCHTCDNPACVRPSHLFVGTHSDNMQDMVRKGRGVTPNTKGEEHGAARLTAQQVLAIRADGRSQRVIAAAYGVAQSLISQIKSRKVWKHLPEHLTP